MSMDALQVALNVYDDVITLKRTLKDNSGCFGDWVDEPSTGQRIYAAMPEMAALTDALFKAELHAFALLNAMRGRRP